LTSAERLRLWLVAGTGDDRTLVDARKIQSLAPAAARTKPTVTPHPFDAVEVHVGAVYRYALRLTARTDAAEDLAQETLLRAWRNREKLRDPRAARVWLLRIATNLWMDQLRQAKFQPRLLESEPPCPRPTATEKSNERENVSRALAAMDQLPPRQRQVLHLVTCEGLSIAEVSEILEIESSAVKANLSLARKEMRRRLSDVYDEVCGRRACRENS
jgi:RNA polymerase sigma-70 factor (ECF subfamily)